MEKNEIETSNNSTNSKSLINKDNQARDIENQLNNNNPIQRNSEYTVHINEPTEFETNKISTSKYTWYNVFPKILIEQFSKMANVYFLIIAIMQVDNFNH
jgi:hypothetical protein